MVLTRRLAVVLCTASLLTMAGPTAQAKPKRPAHVRPAPEVRRYPGVDSELLRQALDAFEEVDYVRSVQLLDKAHEEGTLTKAEKIILHRTLALAHIALGETEQARRDFESLLRVDPDFDLDRTFSPKVRTAFDEARASLALSGGGTTSLPVLNTKRSTDAPRVGQPLVFRLLAPAGTTRVELHYRTQGTTAFSTLGVTPGKDGEVELVVPGISVAEPRLEYYVKAIGAGAQISAADGSSLAPMTIDVRAERRAKKSRAWVWGVVVAAVVVAGGVAAGVAVAMTRPSDTGQVTFVPH